LTSYIKIEIKYLWLEVTAATRVLLSMRKNYQPTETNEQPQAKVINAELPEQLVGLLKAKSNDLLSDKIAFG